MKCVGSRKRSTTDNVDSTCKKRRHRKNKESFSCEIHQHSHADKSSFCEHHVMNTSLLQGEQLRQEFVKRLIRPRATNIWNSSATSAIIRSCDLGSDNKTSVSIRHHDDLYYNHLNKVQLP